jgi:hypothetical protein
LCFPFLRLVSVACFYRGPVKEANMTGNDGDEVRTPLEEIEHYLDTRDLTGAERDTALLQARHDLAIRRFWRGRNFKRNL